MYSLKNQSFESLNQHPSILQMLFVPLSNDLELVPKATSFKKFFKQYIFLSRYLQVFIAILVGRFCRCFCVSWFVNHVQNRSYDLCQWLN